MTMYVILVCGGRDHTPTEKEVEKFEHLISSVQEHFSGNIIIVEGGARGVDAWAREWARIRNIPVATISINRSLDGDTTVAPLNRNHRMIRDMKPKFTFAFPGGNGTKDARDYAARCGSTVILI